VDYVTDHLQAASFSRAVDSSLMWQYLTSRVWILYTPLALQTGISACEACCKGEAKTSYNQENSPLSIQKVKSLLN